MLHLKTEEPFFQTLLREAVIISVTEEVRVCRDAKDDKYLALAVSGQAECVISGDQDLIALHPFRDIPILSPARFLESLPEKPADDTT